MSARNNFLYLGPKCMSSRQNGQILLEWVWDLMPVGTLVWGVKGGSARFVPRKGVGFVFGFRHASGNQEGFTDDLAGAGVRGWGQACKHANAPSQRKRWTVVRVNWKRMMRAGSSEMEPTGRVELPTSRLRNETSLKAIPHQN
jgi:hypothetical protein